MTSRHLVSPWPWLLALAFLLVAGYEKAQIWRLNAAEPPPTTQATLNEFQDPCVTPSWGHASPPDLVRYAKATYLVWRCENGKSYVIRLEPESVR